MTTVSSFAKDIDSFHHFLLSAKILFFQVTVFSNLIQLVSAFYIKCFLPDFLVILGDMCIFRRDEKSCLEAYTHMWSMTTVTNQNDLTKPFL